MVNSDKMLLSFSGATFTDVRHHNRGGWVYVSNAEIRHQDKDMGEGGVGSLTFDSQGRIINYKRVLNGTRYAMRLCFVTVHFWCRMQCFLDDLTMHGRSPLLFNNNVLLE